MSSLKERPDLASEKSDASTRRTWLEGFLHIDPVHIVSDMWDAFDTWRGTRRWRPILMMIPGILFLLSCFVTITVGLMTSNPKKLVKYVRKAEAISPTKADGTSNVDRKAAKKLASDSGPFGKLDDAALDEEREERDTSDSDAKAQAKLEAKNSEYADLLFRRVLQLEPTNKNARYFVAFQQGLRGNTEQARATMQTLAPAEATSYLPAHAWMAFDLLQQVMKGAKLDPIRNELTHHLLVASEWQGTNAFVLSAYAGMLESEGKFTTAINMMQRAAARDNAYFLPLSAMMARHNQPVQAKEAADRAIAYYSESFGKKNETDRDRIAVAEAYVQSQKFDEAIRVLAEGLNMRDDRPMLRRAQSNVYRMMYMNQFKETENGAKANLGLLNAAMMADPTNPAVGEDIAKLQQLGVTVDEKMVKALIEQLSSGGASAITHLLLGHAYMNKQNMKQAMIHWKLALGHDPNLVIAINNLAIGLSMLDPPQIDDALKMIDKAIELSKGEAEFFDSKGEILQRAERHDEAIVQFEKALQINQMRVGTRRNLVKCYETLGMKDLADAQLSFIDKILEKFKSAGLNEEGRRMGKPTPPTKKTSGERKDKTAPSSNLPLPDAIFTDIPSEADKPSPVEPSDKK